MTRYRSRIAVAHEHAVFRASRPGATTYNYDDSHRALGHADIKSTTIYSRVAIAELQRVHEKTHPSAGERGAPGEIVAKSD